MIAKGNLHANGGKLAAYLQTGKDGERAEMVEVRGFLDDDLREGFRQVQAMSAQVTKCEKPFFHAYVRLPEGEGVDRETWLKIADRMEAELGFDGQPRAVAFHVAPDGERHLHVAWSRVDFERERAIDPGLYKLKLKNLCREMEVDYGLQQVTNDRGPEQPKAAKRPEFEEARRHKLEIDDTRQVIRNCYAVSKDGREFIAALQEHGMGLARGDRRDFVVIDAEGGKHALGKPICGEPAHAIREKFGEGFKQGLGSIDEVVLEVRARAAGRQPLPAGADKQPETWQERRAIRAEITALWSASDSGKGFVAAIEAEGYQLAQGDRRTFMLVTPEGNTHALPRMVEGARTADVRAKLADIDPHSLPTITEAKALVQVAAAKQETTQRAEAEAPPSPVKLADNPTAQAIRAALAGAQDGGSFVAGLEDRGLAIAVVGHDEAARSHRVSSFARAAGHWARSYAEGELVVVNSFGAVMPLNQRVTGKAGAELAPILAGVDRAPLMDMASTRSAMREAGHTAFMDAQEAGRPYTATERVIIAASQGAMSGLDFAASVGAEGLTLARLTADDARAIRSGVDPDAARLRRFGEGDLVAVNRFGGVQGLNPHHVDYGLCQALMTDLQRQVPGAVGLESLQATRAHAANERMHVADVWNATRLEAAIAPNQARGHAAEGSIPAKDQVKGSGAADLVAGVAAKAAEVMGDIAGGLAGIFAPEGPPTPEAIENRIDTAQRIEAERPRIEAMSKAERDEAERLAAIQKAQADMEAALRGDDRDRDDGGYERTREG